jgi:hypothetical protein
MRTERADVGWPAGGLAGGARIGNGRENGQGGPASEAEPPAKQAEPDAEEAPEESDQDRDPDLDNILR